MAVKASQSVAGMFVTKDATGALGAASVSAAVLYVNGVVDFTVTVSIVTTDAPFYKWSATLPATLSQGDNVQVCVTATIDGIQTAGVVWVDSVLYDATGVPSAASVATAVDTLLTNNHNAGSWAGGTAGAGSVSYQWPVAVDPITSLGLPADGVAVWITTDLAGLNVVAGTQYTLASGLVAENWLLDPGVYYAHAQRSGLDKVVTEITVTA